MRSSVTVNLMTADNPFQNFSEAELNGIAEQNGFKRKGSRNWIRRTSELVQLLNLQKSQWAADAHYLNFALWPLVFSEPPSLAESKFPFRIRGGSIGANDLEEFFAVIGKIGTLDDLRNLQRSRKMPALITKPLLELLA